MAYKQPEAMTRSLPLGLGEWAIDLSPTRKFKLLKDEYLVNLVMDMNRYGRIYLDCFENVTHQPESFVTNATESSSSQR